VNRIDYLIKAYHLLFAVCIKQISEASCITLKETLGDQ